MNVLYRSLPGPSGMTQDSTPAELAFILAACGVEHRVERINAAYSNMKKKWTQAIRAIILLEHIGTPEATAVLRDIPVATPKPNLRSLPPKRWRE